MPPERPPVPGRLGFRDGAGVELPSASMHDRGVVHLVERQVVDLLASARRDVALDARVALIERELLVDADLKALGERTRAIGKLGRGDESAGDGCLRVVDTEGGDGSEELEDVLLVDRPLR